MGKEWAYLDQKNVLGVEIKSGIHATILTGLFLGIDSSGKAVLADNQAGVSQCAARGASYNNGTHGTYSKTVNDTRASLIRCGKLTGFSGLTPGADAFLSSGGGITLVEPTTPGDLKQVVGFVGEDTETIWVDISPAEVVPSP